MDKNEQAIQFIRENAEEYGQRRSQRMYLENFQKSKLAMIAENRRKEFAERGEKVTEAALSNMAMIDPEYLELLDQTQVAREREEYLNWMYQVSLMEHETWRTEQANQRRELDAYR